MQEFGGSTAMKKLAQRSSIGEKVGCRGRPAVAGTVGERQPGHVLGLLRVCFAFSSSRSRRSLRLSLPLSPFSSQYTELMRETGDKVQKMFDKSLEVRAGAYHISCAYIDSCRRAEFSPGPVPALTPTPPRPARASFPLPGRMPAAASQSPSSWTSRCSSSAWRSSSSPPP